MHFHMTSILNISGRSDDWKKLRIGMGERCREDMNFRLKGVINRHMCVTVWIASRGCYSIQSVLAHDCSGVGGLEGVEGIKELHIGQGAF